jgi:L-2-hydroxyglutarate oxidase LhgO
MGASTRNSGVIHSGLYYPPGSLKALHCVRGNRLTYEFCAAHNVPHRRTGKLVVACDDHEAAALQKLMATGQANGVENMQLIDSSVIRQREPHVTGVLAIEVPSTGIVGSEELVKAYARIATSRGANLVTNTKVERLEAFPGTARLPSGALSAASPAIQITSTAGEITTRCLITSAGLYSDEVAALLGSKMSRHKIYPVRGEYCEFTRPKQNLIRGLVYPLPHSDGLGLGTHFTKTLAGNVWIGPTAHYVNSKNNYEQDREPLETFAELARRLVPEVKISDLVPAHSGIRAKLIPPPSERHAQAPAFADFIIQRDPDFPQVIHLLGIESPGLTSALSIAQQVRDLVAQTL